jgi:hypothetical protein
LTSKGYVEGGIAYEAYKKAIASAYEAYEKARQARW